MLNIGRDNQLGLMIGLILINRHFSISCWPLVMSNTIKSCCSMNPHLETLTHSIIEFVVYFLHLTCLTHLYLAHSGRYHHLFLISGCFPLTAYRPLAAWGSW